MNQIIIRFFDLDLMNYKFNIIFKMIFHFRQSSNKMKLWKSRLFVFKSWGDDPWCQLGPPSIENMFRFICLVMRLEHFTLLLHLISQVFTKS